jgi:hypothetical protein
LSAHIHKAPVWIVSWLEGRTPTRTSGSSIYPAVQNMLLAALEAIAPRHADRAGQDGMRAHGSRRGFCDKVGVGFV